MQTLTPLKDAGRSEEIFEIDCVSDAPTRQAQIDAAVALNLPVVQYRAHRKGKLAIVASGPSATDYVDMLKEWDGEIWGINGAFEWMRHRGIKPHAFIGLDPEWFLKDYLPNPPEDATYYLAAQVHPGVFEHLRDRNVKLWFMADGEVKLPIGSIPIPGGSSCLGRAPYLACYMGWSDVHIFGGDSSFTDRYHVHDDPGGLPSNCVPAEVNGRTFVTTRTFMTQACNMVEIIQNFPGSITVYGDGLMQALAELQKQSGVEEYLKAEESKEFSGMNRKQRRALRKTAA